MKMSIISPSWNTDRNLVDSIDGSIALSPIISTLIIVE
jgi:hypothetical protein